MYNPLTTSSDGINLLDDIEGEVPTTTPQYEPPEESDMPMDNDETNENVDDEAVAVDEDDEEALDVLTTWLVDMADILPSLARRFGALFINDGVGSIRRLAKRVEREREYMETVGVPMDDAEEIYGALQREGMFVEVEVRGRSASKAAAYLHSVSAREAINQLHHTAAAGKEVTSGRARANTLTRAQWAAAQQQGEGSGGGGGADLPARKMTLSSGMHDMIASAAAAATAAVTGHESTSAPRSRADSRLSDIQDPSRGRSNSGAPGFSAALDGHSDTGAIVNVSGKRQAKYRSRESIERAKELYAEAVTSVDNLGTALEGQMEVAVVGVLASIASVLENSGERQRAFYRANVAPILVQTLIDMMQYVSVCERALQVMALLCRHSDDVKTSSSLENSKALGLAGAADAVVGALQRHGVSGEVNRVMEMAADAIRSLSCLESNRTRLGEAGACETLARALIKANKLPELACWVNRAIGHLALNHDANRERLGSAGAIENMVMILQKHSTNMNICTEVCWALRNVAHTEGNRERMANELVPETIAAVLKTHLGSEVFVKEAIRALVACITNEDDEVIQRIAVAGAGALTLKALKRHMESEILSTHAFHLLYFLSSDANLVQKLVNNDILDALSTNLENHAGYERMAEWGCRTVHNLATQQAWTKSRMRAAGLCEMVVSAVQRQAISVSVSGYGCLAIGDLAAEKENLVRLTQSGACEAAVGALKRHDESIEVVVQACYAIHFLCFAQNNISWMGANGACEAVTQALQKHIQDDIMTTQSTSRAIGSLAFKDEGNQLRLHTTGACAAIVTALRTHGQDPLVAEYTCRAVYNMSTEQANVSEFGAKGVCGLIVATMQAHFEVETVLAQACLAIFTLAVKRKTDKVHNGNTRKLVTKGAIECVITALQKYPQDTAVQRAGAMAVASLARLEPNREKLGGSGACALVLAGLKNHPTQAPVLCKMALALDVLSQSFDTRATFAQGGAADHLLMCLSKHDKHAPVVGESIRALITIMAHDDASCRAKCSSENAVKLYVKALKHHDRIEAVAHWGCNMVYALSCWSADLRNLLGNAKACEAVSNALYKLGGVSHLVALWGCKAIVGLSATDSNRLKFHTSESCNAVVNALKSHWDHTAVAEWGCAAVLSMAGQDTNRVKLGSAGVCAALVGCLNAQSENETVVKFGCRAVFEICLDEANRVAMHAAGACECLTLLLKIHLPNVPVAQQCCRAIANLAKINEANATKLGVLGVADTLCAVLKTHPFSTQLVEWCCAAIYALAEKHPANQQLLGHVRLPSSFLTSSSSASVAPTSGQTSHEGGGDGSAGSGHPTTHSSHPSHLHGSGGGHSHTAPSGHAATTGSDHPHPHTSLPSSSSSGVEGGGVGVNTGPGVAELIVVALTNHRTNLPTTLQALKAIRALTLNHPSNRRVFAQCMVVQTVLKTLKTHKLSDTVVENACWVLGNVVVALPVSGTSYSFFTSERGSSPVTIGTTLSQTSTGIGFDTISLEDSSTTNTTVDYPFNPTITTNSTSSLSFSSSPTASSPLQTLRNSVYQDPHHWDLLVGCVETHIQKEQAVRWLAAAVSVFADQGKVPNLPLCDLMMKALTKFIENDTVTQKILHAIGSLAQAHVENRARLVKAHVINAIDTIVGRISGNDSGEASLCQGAFRAVAGLGGYGVSPTTQTRFSELPEFCRTMVKLLYNDLESPMIALWGCEALASLAQSHPGNQTKLGQAGNYLADILSTHKDKPETIKAACRAASVLAHGNITNRNRLGASDACAHVARALVTHQQDRFVAVWAIRAVADLAANNPNNQTKLGLGGACEALVDIVKVLAASNRDGGAMGGSISHADGGVGMLGAMGEMGTSVGGAVALSVTTDDAANAVGTAVDDEAIAKWTVWAIGNMVQLNKISAIMSDSDKSTNGLEATTSPSILEKDDSERNLNIPSDLSTASVRSTSGNKNTSPKQGPASSTSTSGDLFKDLGISSPEFNRMSINISSNVNQLLNLKGLGAFDKKTSVDTIKNTGRFLEAGLAGPLLALIARYAGDDHYVPTIVSGGGGGGGGGSVSSPAVCQWGCRALTNLAKNKALRVRLSEAGAKGVLDRVLKRFSQYSDQPVDKAVAEWALLAKESLFNNPNDYHSSGNVSQGNNAQSKVPSRPFPARQPNPMATISENPAI